MAKKRIKKKKAEQDATVLAIHEIQHRLELLESGGTDGGGLGPGTQVTVVDSSGTVIGTGRVTRGGVVRTDIVRTTVVNRTPGGTDQTVTGGGWSVTTSTTDTTTDTGGAIRRSGGAIPPLFYVSPYIFDFHDVNDNWQETGCAPIYFSYLPPFSPIPTRIDVGVKVGAPKELADGTVIHPWDAQAATATAAEAAALEIIAELRAGALMVGQIQKRFTGYLFGQLALLGQGYRVQGCVPG
jgi:hypothetical protein